MTTAFSLPTFTLKLQLPNNFEIASRVTEGLVGFNIISLQHELTTETK
jgi:hypothetical protein